MIITELHKNNMEMKENDFFVDLVEVVLRFRFVALVEMVEVVIPVESVENEKAHWEYQDEDDVHQPYNNRIRISYGVTRSIKNL